METQSLRFNRSLAAVLAALYLLTITAFSVFGLAADPSQPPLWETLLNALIVSIPLVLLYGSIYVLVTAWRQHAAGQPLAPRLAQVIHWAPRAAAITISLFLGLFSLDVFDNPETTLLEELGGFVIHSLPSIALLALLAIAWKRPAVGFWAFLVAAVLLAAISLPAGAFAIANLLLFVLPALMVAGLFYVDWKWVR